MKVRMLRALTGTVDGVRLARPLLAGAVYDDLDPDFAQRLIDSALAEEHVEKAPEPLDLGEPAMVTAPEPLQPAAAEAAPEPDDLN